MRKTELIVSGEVICPKTKASIVAHEHTNVEALLDQQNRTSSTITQSASTSKVGLGDGEDLSFCVEDGFYESATLYGKTLVNSIQEPSSKDVVLPYAFENGQHVTINDTKESGALGVELKGQTLVNVVDYDDLNLNNATRNGDYFTLKHGVDVNQSWVIPKKNDQYLYKPNTMYTIIVNITENTTGQRLGISNIYTCTSYVNGKNRFDNLLGESKLLVRTGSDVNVPANQSEVRQLTYFGIWDGSGDLTTHIKFNFMILEGDWTDKETPPYFTGMASCKMPILHTVGKNLFDGELITGKIEDNGKPNIYVPTMCMSANYTRVQPNTTYNYKWNQEKNSSRVFFYDVNKNFIKKDENAIPPTGGQFTTPSNCYYILFHLAVNAGMDSYTVVITKNNDLTYEPHKSSILSLPEEVVLRSLPNGVCDTFNTRTGVYTQRIGEAVVNGSENWQLNNTEGTTTQRFFCNMLANSAVDNNTKGTQQYLCDRLRTIAWNQTCELGVTINGSGVFVYNNSIEYTVSSVKQWLSQNPVKLQYELATPVVTKINLSSTLKSWNTTTHIYSEIPENTLYPTLSHSNPTYPVILKPSTKYSIVANSYSNDHTNSAINFNLGGATTSTTVGKRVTTITTPSTLSNELLTMSGRGNKLNHVMVIEGDVVGDEPYFEGICDCKSPILSNVGKNLFGVDLILGAHTYGNVGVKPTHGTGYPRVTNKTGDYIPVKPNTTYIFSINNNISFAIAQLDSNGISLGDTGWVNHKSSWTMTTHSMTHFIGFNFKKADDSTIAVDEVRNASPMLEESSTVTSYKPYKTNILSANGDKIELTEDMFEQGSTLAFSSNIGNNYSSIKSNANNRIRIKELILVKPNTTYSVKCSNDFTTALGGFDKNGNLVGVAKAWADGGNAIFTTGGNVVSLCCNIKRLNEGAITPNNFNEVGIELREVDKTIVLRSLPNGVCDTLNVETGEYVQRIGEGVFNGSENWLLENFVHDTLIEFKLTSDYRVKSNNSLICDGFTPTLQNNVERIYMFANGVVYVRILKTKVASVGDFKQYLQTNPLTIQYELITPITKTVDLNGYPFAYKDGHVILSSGSVEPSLTPKIEYVVQTNRAGAIQANQDRLLNHDKRLAMLEDLVLHQLIQLEYNRAKCTFLSQTRQIFEGGIQMYHTKYELLSEFIEKKLYRSLEEVFEMLDVYFMLGDITDGEYDTLYEALMPSAEEIFEVEETFDHEDVEV